MAIHRNGFSIIPFVLFTACQTMPYQGQAHDVKRKPNTEGVVAIPINYRPEDRQAAEQHMASNCGGKQIKVVEEGEAIIGEHTTSAGHETDRASTQHKVGSLFGVPVVSGEAAGHDTERSQTVTQLKEWQINYRCM